MDREQSLELLQSTYQFPTKFVFKAIGLASEEFVTGVVVAIREETQLEFDPPFETKTTSQGRHVSVTVEPEVESAEVIIAIYARLKEVPGLVMLL